MGKGVWGIDVSKFSAKAVRLESAGESLTLTHVGVFSYDGAGGGEGQDLDRQIMTTLSQIKTAYKISGEPIIFSLPSHSTFNRLIKLPPVDDAKIPEIVKYEAQSQIPFNIDEVIWDYQFVDRQYQPGEEKEVILFAIKRDIVEQFMANIAELNFNIGAIQFSPVALFNFLVRDQGLQGPSVALDMGGDNTDLIVIDGTKFWVRNLPITGNDITKALQKAFNIPFEEAEKLKLRAGQSQQAQKIFNAIQPVLRDLVNEINRSMGYYKSISKTSKFERILLLGNSTKTLNFQKFVSQSLQLPAVRVQKLNTIGVGGQVDPGELNESLATIGTALGLALQGSADTANRVNLLPPAYLRKKELAKKKPFILATAAALGLLVGMAYAKQSGEVDKLTLSKNSGRQMDQMVKSREEDLKNAKQVADVRDQLEPLVGISSERDLVLKILDEINPNIPENGKWDVREDQKIWVVDWKFEEREKPKAGEGGAAPAVMAPGLPGVMRPLPREKILYATLEVVILKRAGDVQGQDFIIQRLLNYNPNGRQPIKADRPCVIKNKHWELTRDQWKVELDHGTAPQDALVWPVPKNFPQAKNPPDIDKKFWRYRVALEIPVGEESRKSASATEKK